MAKSLRRVKVWVVMLAGFVALGAQIVGAQSASPVDEIRKQLLRLPYYSVFDFLAFSLDKGTVTLQGYAYWGTLSSAAEQAVKRAPGVDTVVNKIEQLPVSPNDDGIRWGVYYAIYTDAFLSRYAPGGGLPWGWRRSIRGPWSFARFPGMEPLGDYPIHIIVKGGRVTLLGVVDNESDKTLAGFRAREVPGSFGVDNELIVGSK